MTRSVAEPIGDVGCQVRLRDELRAAPAQEAGQHVGRTPSSRSFSLEETSVADDRDLTRGPVDPGRAAISADDSALLAERLISRFGLHIGFPGFCSICGPGMKAGPETRLRLAALTDRRSHIEPLHFSTRRTRLTGLGARQSTSSVMML